MMLTGEEVMVISRKSVGKIADKKTFTRKERRKFKRWCVSIPCQVEWGRTVLKGKLTDLSYDGACISGMKLDLPSEGDLVALHFRAENEVLKLPSRVIYTIRQIKEGGGVHTFGVQFQEPLKSVKLQLVPLFLKLRQRGIEAQPEN